MKRTVRIKIFPPALYLWYVSVGFPVALPVKIHGLFHTTPEEFENIFFTLKTRQMLPSKLLRRNLKTQQPPASLVLCLRKTRAGKSHDYRDAIVFRKAPFSAKCFPSTLKRKAGVFKFLHFEERFRILVPFS